MNRIKLLTNSSISNHLLLKTSFCCFCKFIVIYIMLFVNGFYNILML